MKTLTARQVEYANAWALALESAKPDDRRLVALFAMATLGNIPVVRCGRHGGQALPPMTFTEAYRHITDTPEPCVLLGDESGIEVAP